MEAAQVSALVAQLQYYLRITCANSWSFCINDIMPLPL